jgi:hypothetical protein
VEHVNDRGEILVCFFGEYFKWTMKYRQLCNCVQVAISLSALSHSWNYIYFGDGSNYFLLVKAGVVVTSISSVPHRMRATNRKPCPHFLLLIPLGANPPVHLSCYSRHSRHSHFSFRNKNKNNNNLLFLFDSWDVSLASRDHLHQHRLLHPGQ